MAEITSQEQFEKVRDALKAGQFADDPVIEQEILEAAEAWKASQNSPVEGMSGLERFRAGAGKAFSDIGLGIRQLPTLLPASPISRETRIDLEEEAARRKERDAPLMETGAGLAGNIAGDMTAFLPFGGAVRGVKGATTLGGAEGLIRPAEDIEERKQNVAFGAGGGAVGQGVIRGAQRLFRPIKSSLSPRGEEAVELLRREGIDLDVSQQTGSAAAGRIRSSFGDNPLTVSRQKDFLETQQRQFSRAVLRRIGADSDEATPEVLQEATERIGKQIDDAVLNTPPFWDVQFSSDLQRIQGKIVREMTDADAKPLLRNVRELFSAWDQSTNTINPSKFTDVRSSLSALSRKNPLARELESSMMNMLERSGGDNAGLKQALAQWRNFRIIEGAIDKDADRLISPMRLSNAFGNIRNRAVSFRELGHPETIELARLAAAGRSILPEDLGNSGTFGRALVGEGLLFTGGGLGALASGQDVEDAAAIGLGAAALPVLLQRGLLSQGLTGNYLASGANPAGVRTALETPLAEILLRQAVISSTRDQE